MFGQFAGERAEQIEITRQTRHQHPQGGREGYTFDIEWSGGNGYYGNPSASGPYSNGPYSNGGSGNGGYGNGGGYGRDRDRDGDRDRYDDRGRYSNNSGWGDNSNNGYGNRAYDGGGWNNGWGNTITYRGQGRGQFAMARGQGYRIYGADVNVDRNTGRVQVNLDSDMGRDALSFVGRIQQVTGDTIIADVRAAGNNQGNVAGANGGASRRCPECGIKPQADHKPYGQKQPIVADPWAAGKQEP